MRRLSVFAAVAMSVFAAQTAAAQVFYPQAGLAPAGAYGVEDNLDMTLEFEAFAGERSGKDYSGVSVGSTATIGLSDNVDLEISGRTINTSLGNAYEYGAGLNIHGPRGELYGKITSISAEEGIYEYRDGTRVDLGGEYQVNNNLRVGFDMSTTLDQPLLRYDEINSPYSTLR